MLRFISWVIPQVAKAATQIANERVKSDSHPACRRQDLRGHRDEQRDSSAATRAGQEHHGRHGDVDAAAHAGLARARRHHHGQRHQAGEHRADRQRRSAGPRRAVAASRRTNANPDVAQPNSSVAAMPTVQPAVSRRAPPGRKAGQEDEPDRGEEPRRSGRAGRRGGVHADPACAVACRRPLSAGATVTAAV